MRSSRQALIWVCWQPRRRKPKWTKFAFDRDEKQIPTRARTLEGLIFKARYAASHFKEDYDEEVMR